MTAPRRRPRPLTRREFLQRAATISAVAATARLWAPAQREAWARTLGAAAHPQGTTLERFIWFEGFAATSTGRLSTPSCAPTTRAGRSRSAPTSPSRSGGARTAERRSRPFCTSPTTSSPTPSEAVAASCAIPGYFAPLDIGGVEYFDGGVRSPTNADVLRSSTSSSSSHRCRLRVACARRPTRSCATAPTVGSSVRCGPCATTARRSCESNRASRRSAAWGST
jgi:hypothetical protein